ncbi:hypothetical protein B0T19DRAFT_467189 [Cercophora scortea]|uniref:LysM domain-containing protein n=1 Tax=Cercophora scortea TaxID=314031 RepID=A0AAE0I6W0_9PEZI|nr:hypothetical protein B0T19DRAFT_467189 [Cercophora scortea]
MRKLAGINPTNQLSTATRASTLMCDGCMLSMFKTQIKMPLLSNADLSTAFSRLTSSCKVTTLKVTAPGTATQWAISSTSTTKTGSATSSSASSTSTACVGKTYTIQSSDRCTSVALSQRIGTTALFAANNLKADCKTFPKTGTLCIPSASACTPHQVSFAAPIIDTCADLVRANNATVLQLVAWNPELGTNCANLNRLSDGYTMCLSSPGGSWIDPHPSSSSLTVNATTTSVDTIFTLSMTPIPDSYIITGIVMSSPTASASLSKAITTGG